MATDSIEANRQDRMDPGASQIAMFKIHEKRRAKQRGSMLLFCLAVMAGCMLMLGLGFSFYFLFFYHDLLQQRSESFAMKAAQELNLDDSAGKLNNLVGYSRELAFTAREMCTLTENNDDFREVQPLAAQVLGESHDGVKLVAQERERFVNALVVKLRQLMSENLKQAPGPSSLVTTTTSSPEIVDFELGTLENMQSSVEPSKGVPELSEYDLRKHYIQPGKGTDLYLSSVNLKLPDPRDSDLEFYLSPLPAPVQGTVAPLRLTSEKRFVEMLPLRKDGQDKQGTSKLSPPALRVVMSVKVKNKILIDTESGTKATDTVCASGASPDPK